jgi:hypothetical protein
VRTDDLIVQLARAAGPVRPLARPSVRLARWTAAALPFAVLCVVAIGARHDLGRAIQRPTFVALAAVSLLTGLAAAASSFVMSVPGSDRSALRRALPVALGAVWAFALLVLVFEGGDPVRRILALPIHAACVIEIAGIAVVPSWALFAMIRRAAPLQLAWSAGLATLAGVGLGAAATQVICPLDDPAHQLVGHVLPAAILVLAGTLVGRRSLDWFRRAHQR